MGGNTHISNNNMSNGILDLYGAPSNPGGIVGAYSGHGGYGSGGGCSWPRPYAAGRSSDSASFWRRASRPARRSDPATWDRIAYEPKRVRPVVRRRKSRRPPQPDVVGRAIQHRSTVVHRRTRRWRGERRSVDATDRRLLSNRRHGQHYDQPNHVPT